MINAASSVLRWNNAAAKRVARCFSTVQELPKEVDVVVIGGGSIGSSAAYHLQKSGLSTLLLEKDQLTSGTTWHSAGMLWRLRPSDTDIELHTYTRQMCIDLEEQTGQASWHENGGLFIANNEERFTEYKRLKEMGKYYGIPCEVLEPNEIQDVHPLIAVGDVTGAIYSPTDGTIDPTGIVMAYTKAARQLGATVREKVDVSKIHYDTFNLAGKDWKQVQGVETACGQFIKTKQIVNAAGIWADEVSNLIGESIPLKAIKHAFVVTEKLEGMHSMLPNVRDHDLSIYLKTQGTAMAIGGYEQNPEFWETQHDFSFGLFELNFDTFDQNFQGHIKRAPLIESSGIVSTVCGPESFTPDHKPLVGPHPGVQGFFQACGFNSMGMMLAGGMGREIATWINEGSPSIDMFGFDCARFRPESNSDQGWIVDRTHESYAKTYSIVFPQDESMAGRGFKKSGIYDQLLERGCVFQARHAFERPGWFNPNSPTPVDKYDYYGAYADGGWRLGEGIADVPENKSNKFLQVIEDELTFDWSPTFEVIREECRAAREGVAIFDQSYFGKFYLSGKDADEAVQYICGADMEAKPLGSVTYTPLCNVRGGVEADLTVTKLHDGSGYYFAAGGNTMTKDFNWISRVIQDKGYDVKFVDESDSIDMISVQGPHSRTLVQSLIDISIDDESIPFSSARDGTIAGVKLMCMRLTFVGELGFELHVPRDQSKTVYEALRKAGEVYEAEVGVPVRDAGYRAIDSLSAEKGFRHWHADLSNKDTPLEAGIGFTVLKKLKRENGPDFLGRKALEDQRKRGLQRKLVCLTLEEKQLPLLGMETMWRDGHCVGLVKSTAFGYSVGKTIAYGYVDCTGLGVKKITNDWLKSGTWEIGDADKRYKASLSISAPFDPKGLRMKGQY